MDFVHPQYYQPTNQTKNKKQKKKNQPTNKQGSYCLDCYWVGSLDFNFLGNTCVFPLNASKVRLLAGGSLQQPSCLRGCRLARVRVDLRRCSAAVNLTARAVKLRLPLPPAPTEAPPEGRHGEWPAGAAGARAEVRRIPRNHQSKPMSGQLRG